MILLFVMAKVDSSLRYAPFRITGKDHSKHQ